MFKSNTLRVLLSFGAAGSSILFLSNGSGYFKRISNSFGLSQYACASFGKNTDFANYSWDTNWDMRDPFHQINPSELNRLVEESEDVLKNKLQKFTPTATRHLIFIRHGQYNTQFKDDEKRTLTALGQEQAILTGIRLHELGINYDHVIESSMTRAIETSNLIRNQLSNVTVERTDLLREGSPISPEPPFRHWRPERHTFRDQPRIESAFRKYVHRADVSQKEDTFEIIVCHANVIRYIVCRALQLPPEAWLRMSLHHGSITWVSVNPKGYVSVKCIGEAGHMPPDKLTFE